MSENEDAQDLVETDKEKLDKMLAIPEDKRSFGQRQLIKRLTGAQQRSAEPAKRPDRSKSTRVKLADRNRIRFDNMEPGYHYHVFNDTPGRLEKMQSVGYEFVESDEPLGDFRVAEGSKLGRAVSKQVGGGQKGYLMRIKEEYYEEDKAEKAKRVDVTESALRPKKENGEYGSGVTNE
jgi:hypothetical protein